MLKYSDNLTLHSKRLIFICLACSIALGHGFGQSTTHLRKQIRKIIKHDLDHPIEKVPGFIVGIIDEDATYVIPFGARTLGVGDTLRSTDVFELGSLSKLITAHIVMSLAAEKVLSLDDPLNLYLPNFYQNPEIDATIRDILLHYGGLPKIPKTLGSTQDDLNNPYANFTRRDLLSWYRGLNADSTIAFRYTHTGYALLELVTEHAAGQQYPDLLEHYIHDGLGLTQISLTSESLAPGYDLALRPTDPWSFPSFSTSEGIRGSLADLLAFVRLQIEMEHNTGSLDEMKRETDHRKISIAPGLYCILPKPDVRVWMHTGHTSGHSAFLAFAPATKTGVVLLANSSAGTGDLGLLILRMINRQWKRR
jgi:CubicO group peptidase (beta-lactamase class C family)